jgi:hypothetical protein
MRKICGLRATDVIAGEGEGFSFGTGRPITPEANVWISLAGPLSEVRFLWMMIDWETSHSDDLESAIDSIEKSYFLRLDFDPKDPGKLIEVPTLEALKKEARKASEQIIQYHDLIEKMAYCLIDNGGKLSAQSVAAYVRKVKMVMNGAR